MASARENQPGNPAEPPGEFSIPGSLLEVQLGSCPHCGNELSPAGAPPTTLTASVETEGDPAAYLHGLRRRCAELEQRVTQLESINRQQDEFCGRIAFDLTEPLRKIRSFGELLEYEFGQELSAEARDYLKSMKQSSLRLGRVVDGLYAHARAGDFLPVPEPVNLERLLQAVQLDLARPVRDSKAFFSRGFLPDIHADREHLQRVLRELTLNAIQFRKRGGTPLIEIWVEFGWEPGDFSLPLEFRSADVSAVPTARARWCRLVVRDNGRGFDPGQREAVFEPLRQIEPVAADAGPGVGLAICRRLVERMGGSLEALSHHNKGAAFIVLLPVNQVGNWNR